MSEVKKQKIREVIRGKFNDNATSINQRVTLKELQNDYGWQAVEIQKEMDKAIKDDPVWLELLSDGYLRLKEGVANEIFATGKNYWKLFWQKNWPNIVSNFIALVALIFSGIALFLK